MMMALDDEAVRRQLQAGLNDVPVAVGDFEAVRRAGSRRHRRNQAVMGGGVLAVTVAAVIAVVAVVGGSPQQLGNHMTPIQVAAEQQQELKVDAGLDRAKSSYGPVTDAAGTWAFFSTYKGHKSAAFAQLPSAVHVLRWTGDSWAKAAVVPMDENTGAATLLKRGPKVAGDGASAFVQLPAGDSVPGAIIVRINNTWQLADFEGCGLPASDGCTTNTDAESNLVVKHGRVINYPDDGMPYAAAGTTYTTKWAWNATVEKFVATSMIATSGPLATTSGSATAPLTPATSTLPAGESYCSNNDPADDLYVTNVVDNGDGTFTASGNQTELICGGPDDVSYQEESMVESVIISPSTAVKVVKFVAAGPRDRSIPADQLATYLATDMQTKIFKLTTSAAGLVSMAELYHP